MQNDNIFQYTYSAQENQEVLNIRKKYLPPQESKLDELKRLDHMVQSSGVAQALCVGIGGCLIFGAGMCFAMKVIGDVMWLGILLGMVGIAGMLLAYPVNRRILEKAREKYAPRILELTRELTGEME